MRVLKAMDAYRGRRSDLHVAVIRAAEVDPVGDDDAGWTRLASTHERHVLPGGHMSMLTRHVGELARVIRGVTDRALERRRAAVAPAAN